MALDSLSQEANGTAPTDPPDAASATSLAKIAAWFEDDVSKSLNSGWSPADLDSWLVNEGISPAAAARIVQDEAVDEQTMSALRKIYGDGFGPGFPRAPFAPSRSDMRQHIVWLTDTRPHDDLLIEIAFTDSGGGEINSSRLFACDQIEEAIEFACVRNRAGSNLYIGVALKKATSDPNKRCSGDDFAAATAVPVDIDKDFEATMARLGESGAQPGCFITTGLIPTKRAQLWVRLAVSCERIEEFGQAFASFVAYCQADPGAKDAARVMRLGGSISYPSRDKLKRGYKIELTALIIDEQADTSALEDLIALSPDATYDNIYHAGANVHRRYAGEFRLEIDRSRLFGRLLL